MEEFLGVDMAMDAEDLTVTATGDSKLVSGRACLAQDILNALMTPRQATYLIGKKNKEDLIIRVHAEYPNCIAFTGTDDEFDQFVNNKLYINGDFVEKPPYVPPLETVQAAKIAELKALRNQKELEPIEYNGTMFDADKDSLDRLNYAIITLTVGNKQNIEWTAADNTDVQMSANDLSAVIAAVGLRSDTLHRRYRELKVAVQAAQSNEEVEAVSW